MTRAVCTAAGATVLILAARPAARQDGPPPLVRVGEPQKVCQLTGDVDWESGRPTAARTLTNFGLDAVDLGYPVEHNGKLILLFVLNRYTRAEADSRHVVIYWTLSTWNPYEVSVMSATLAASPRQGAFR